jgi:hypothetical protein
MCVLFLCCSRYGELCSRCFSDKLAVLTRPTPDQAPVAACYCAIILNLMANSGTVCCWYYQYSDLLGLDEKCKHRPALTLNSDVPWLPCIGIRAMRVEQKQSESRCKDSLGAQGPRLAASPVCKCCSCCASQVRAMNLTSDASHKRYV